MKLINVGLVAHFISFSYIKKVCMITVYFLCNSHFRNNGISIWVPRLNMKCKKKNLSVCSVIVLSISVWWYSHRNRDL